MTAGMVSVTNRVTPPREVSAATLLGGAAMDDPYKTVTPGEAGWVVKVGGQLYKLNHSLKGAWFQTLSL
jgi:hypothetical protein